MIVRVTLSAYDIQTLISDHVRKKFDHLVTHKSEYLAIKFPEGMPSIEVELESKPQPHNERD